ncbi:MAG: DUF3592 domain-containing protein [Anaerolineales bacterium]|nr:DUF3592 domain-containing protein [Anaerolineales bacterium]MCB9128950.1 DUF3592 domain-containing protein [Ardenticatenales bacterium]MCB9172817.1 DUF3592 domain-containing protein [Ardenticatenales bacterium]
MGQCPWCGSPQANQRTNCLNCGGPLIPIHEVGGRETPVPPPAPRPISERYKWRYIASDIGTITGLFVSFVGAIFFFMGLAFLVGRETRLLGVAFVPIGALMVLAFVAAGIRGYRKAVRFVRVLRIGLPTEGRLTSLREQHNVEINGRHPWILHYGYTVADIDYQGEVRTLDDPRDEYQVGQPLCVLYDPDLPSESALYPHP